MLQQKEDGSFNPTKLFPCDCGSEGVMVAVELDDKVAEPAIRMAYWQLGTKLSNSELIRWNRIRLAWRILWGGSPYTDMVWMSRSTTRNLANHLLYLLAKGKREKKDAKVEGKDRAIVPLI